MKRKIKKPVTIAAVAAALVCLSMAVYGQELVRIIKTVTLGNYAEYVVVEDNREFIPIPEEIKGQVFDKDGNELQVFPEDGILYGANGKEVMPIYEEDRVRLMTKEEFASTRKADLFTTNDLKEGKAYFICDTLSPDYLPDGYVFDRIEFHGNPASQEGIELGANKYMNVYYSDGENEIYSQIRYMDEETAFGSSASASIQKTKINGHDVVIDGNSLNIQIDDVMYMFFANENLNTDELVKMAESLK